MITLYYVDYVQSIQNGKNIQYKDIFLELNLKTMRIHQQSVAFWYWSSVQYSPEKMVDQVLFLRSWFFGIFIWYMGYNYWM